MQMCQQEVLPLAISAYLKWAADDNNQQQYAASLAVFTNLFQLYPTATAQPNVRAPIAATMLQSAAGEVTAGLCPKALPTYQQVAAQFADTPAGSEAAAALQRPVNVTGHFTNPVPPHARVYLAHDLFSHGFGYLSIIFQPSTRNGPVSGDSHFVFVGMPLGTYDLAWAWFDASGHFLGSSLYVYGNRAEYVANVQPICGYDFGDITAPFK
jgi:hypothetical protein